MATPLKVGDEVRLKSDPPSAPKMVITKEVPAEGEEALRFVCEWRAGKNAERKVDMFYATSLEKPVSGFARTAVRPRR